MWDRYDMYNILDTFLASREGVFLSNYLLFPLVSIFKSEYIWEAEVKYNLVLMCLQLSPSVGFLYFQ